MTAQSARLFGSLERALLRCTLAGILAAGASAQTGSWVPLVHPAPGGVNLMMLLSDGTVMAANNNGGAIGNAWYRLTPDSLGSYRNGTWTVLAAAHDTRLYYPSQVLRNGRVFVAGGEYGSGGPHAEVYDPQTNAWTLVTPPASLWNPASDNFYDCNSELTPDGRVLIMPVFPHTSGIPLLYNPVSNSWSTAGHLFRGTWQDEASWVKLADESILTIDPWDTFSERYIPASNTWVDDGIVPVAMYDPYGFELGAGLLLPDGRGLFLGSTGHTALYAPTGSTSPGTWTAGPDIPGNHGTPDAPAAMMRNGRILCAVSPIPTAADHFPSPTSFYEYDPVANSFASLSGPTGATLGGSCYQKCMLDLPDGTVLLSYMGAQLQIYTPAGATIAAAKPSITSVTPNPDGSFHLVGTGLTGISEGASYGDDFQMNTNYPIVRLTGFGGIVFYARTYDWSTTSVMTGSTLLSTEFSLPASFTGGVYDLVVIANGVASDPVPFDWGAIIIPGCFGDASSGAICPCFNLGDPGRGCNNSVTTGGALLTAIGLPQLANDSLVLTSSGELPTSMSIVLQGTTEIAPVPFGDGLRCTGGSLKRLYAIGAVAGSLSAPPAGALSISARSSFLGDTIVQGETRTYQVYYRDSNITFCPHGFNVSNGLTVTWDP